MSLTRGLVLDVANQVGGAMPSVVTLHDWSRFENDGTTMTAITWTQLPTGLWVANYNGTTSLITIPATSPSLDFTTGEFSIFMAVYSENNAAYPCLFAKGDVSQEGYHFRIDTNGALILYTSQAAANQATSSANGAIVEDTWYIVGFSRSGANVCLYINGIDITDTAGVHIDPLTPSAELAAIGIRADAGGNQLTGHFALLRTFNYALTPAQHRAMYHSKKWLFGVAS